MEALAENGIPGAAGNRGFPVVLPVVLLLAGMLIEPFVPGIYSAEEMHPHMVLAEPGTRGVPQWNPRFDGDGTAFTALDRDGSGGVECRPQEGGGGWDCPEIRTGRMAFRFFRTFFPKYDTTGVSGVPDGFLDATEFPPPSAFPEVFKEEGWGEPNHLERMDQNRDGRISLSEVNEQTRIYQLSSSALIRMDADGDHIIRRDEFQGAPETALFILGCDELGRDLWTRALRGGATSLRIAFGATALSLLLGFLLGWTAGVTGGKVDRFILRFADFWMALPALLLMVVVVAAVGSSPWTLAILLGCLNWVAVTRLVRMQVRSVRGHGHVEAARALGAHPARIAVHHMLRVGWRPVAALGVWLVAIVIAEEGA